MLDSFLVNCGLVGQRFVGTDWSTVRAVVSVAWSVHPSEVLLVSVGLLIADVFLDPGCFGLESGVGCGFVIVVAVVQKKAREVVGV